VTTQSLHASIQSARYAATHAQVEQLARAVIDGQESAGLYLQTLIASVQAILRRRSKRAAALTEADVLAAIDAAYKPSYAAVQRGAARGETLTPRQLAARCGFARTSASALRKYVESGGDMMALVPGKVSRRQLRPEGPEVPAGTTRAERTMLLALARIERVAERAATKDPAVARDLLEQAVEALSARLDALADGNSEPPPQPGVRVVSHRLQRTHVGTQGSGARA
jgi:hypothetical protein